MKGTRLYKLIILLLIVINISTLVMVSIGKPPHPPKPGEGPKLSEILELTGENKTKVDLLEKRHHKKKKVLMEKDNDLHQQMFSRVGSDEGSNEIQFLLSENKKDIEKMTFDFFNEVSTYCSKNQVKELKKFISDAMINMGRRPQHHSK